MRTLKKKGSIGKYSYPDLPARRAAQKKQFLQSSICTAQFCAPKGLTLAIHQSLSFSQKRILKLRMDKTSLLPGFLTQLFRHSSILFIGCSLEEPELERILDGMSSIFQSLRKFDDRIAHHKKYFLAGRKTRYNTSGDPDGFDEDAEKREVERLQKFNIELLRYDNHDIINEVLDLLKNNNSPKPALTPTH